jgi:hypothetical protein
VPPASVPKEVAIASPEPLSDSPLRPLKPLPFLLVQHASSPVTVDGYVYHHCLSPRTARKPYPGGLADRPTSHPVAVLRPANMFRSMPANPKRRIRNHGGKTKRLVLYSPECAIYSGRSPGSQCTLRASSGSRALNLSPKDFVVFGLHDPVVSSLQTSSSSPRAPLTSRVPSGNATVLSLSIL